MLDTYLKTYTQKQVAEALNISPEAVFGLMVGRFINPDTGKPIHPDNGIPSELLRASVFINSPVSMKWRIATEERLPGYTATDFGRGFVHKEVEVKLMGLFGIDANFLDWDVNGKASGTFGGRTRACLHRGEITYMVTGPLKIDRDKLVVTDEDLKHYMEITGNLAELPEDNSDAKMTTVSQTPLNIQEKPVIRLPRLEYYTPEELAEYWRDELGITTASDSRVRHYVHVGTLKTSLRYEYPDGRGWFFEEAPARTSMIDILNSPPAEKYYIRLQDAERFERDNFVKQVSPPITILSNEPITAQTTPTSVKSAEVEPVLMPVVIASEPPQKKERPPQLDRTDKPRGIGKLIKDALLKYYAEKDNKCETLASLVIMMSQHMTFKPKIKLVNHPYLSLLFEIGKSDDNYLYVMTPKGKQWYSRKKAQRTFKTQVQKVIYPPKKTP